MFIVANNEVDRRRSDLKRDVLAGYDGVIMA